MQRRPSEETRDRIVRDCEHIAAIAEPDDSYRRIAEKVEGLSQEQVRRRVQAMERDLGWQPASRTELGGGRRCRDGRPAQHSRPCRRAGEVARAWQRRAGAL